jgi:hypothetical protein
MSIDGARLRHIRTDAYFKGLTQSGGGGDLEAIPNDGEPGSDEFVSNVNEAMKDYEYGQTNPRFETVDDVRKLIAAN